MERKKWIIPAILTLMLAGGSLSGCITTQNGEQGIEALEGMSELEYSKLRLYIQLGVKVGGNLLLQEGAVTEEELDLAASALELVRDQSIITGTQGVIGPALEGVGLTSSEIHDLLSILELELASRGALSWINPETGMIELSPRTQEILTAVANSLRAATLVSGEEMRMYNELQAE
jgi:hypothetical protein